MKKRYLCPRQWGRIAAAGDLFELDWDESPYGNVQLRHIAVCCENPRRPRINVRGDWTLRISRCDLERYFEEIKP